MWLSRTDIEGYGNRVIRAYMRLPTIAGENVKSIEPERLAKEVCGLNIDCCHLSQTQMVLGMTSFGEVEVGVYDEDYKPFFYQLDGKTILVESDLAQNEEQRGRYHFTVMHEVAHQILKMLFPREFSEVKRRVHYSLRYREQRGGMDWEEWQADCLASVLLLPAPLVLRTADEFGLAGGIPILNKIYRPAEFERFAAMAEQLGASKQALAIRLKQLGLLGREYLKDPHALVDIEKEIDEE